MFEGQEVKDLFGRENNGGEEGGWGDGWPLWESLGLTVSGSAFRTLGRSQSFQ